MGKLIDQANLILKEILDFSGQIVMEKLWENKNFE